MFVDILQLPLMAIEIMVSELVFCKYLKKRSYFYLRFFGSMLVIVELIALFLFQYYLINEQMFSYEGESHSNFEQSLIKFVLFLIIYMLTILGMFFCYGAKKTRLLFDCTKGFASQHLATNVSKIITLGIVHFSPGVSQFAYLKIICDIICVATILLLANRFLVKNDDGYYSGKSAKRKTLLSIIVVFLCLGVSRFSNDNPLKDDLSSFTESLYAIISCGLILTISLGIVREDNIENDKRIVENLLEHANEQYKRSKDSIEFINIKYHDLKHILDEIKEEYNSEKINSIESQLQDYNCAIKTGNVALDIILTEKKIACNKNHILLNCVVNGTYLNFMDEKDIYYLFENAISNAVECVKNIDNVDYRQILINTAKKGNIVSIHFSNYCFTDVRFDSVLPVSSKEGVFHGFGMKSMQFIAEKYDGCMTVEHKNNEFIVDFIFLTGNEN